MSFFILVSNIGLSFNIHYCGNEIASLSLNTNLSSISLEEDCCGIFEQKSHCCKDKLFHFQKKVNEFTVKSFSLESNSLFFFEKSKPIVFALIPFNHKQIGLDSFYSHVNAPPLYKLYCQYTFYA